LAERQRPIDVNSASEHSADTAVIADPLFAEWVENLEASKPAAFIRLLQLACKVEYPILWDGRKRAFSTLQHKKPELPGNHLSPDLRNRNR
jgi:hypothetical protein